MIIAKIIKEGLFMEVQPATIMVILSGILTGLVFGFVLQRGRY